MIVAKTPLRIPLAGGLTDLKPYAERFGGVTVSATIDKYVYVVLKANLDGVFDLKYQDVHEKTSRAERLRHDLTREALRLTGLQETPLSIAVLTDLASESGLGSSGAVTVALLHAMHAFKGERPDPLQLASEAAHIEVEVLGGASGYHDPTVCALGGLRLLEYHGAEVTPRPLDATRGFRERFERSLLLFYSGRHAKSKPSLDLLTSHLEGALESLHRIKALGYELADAFAAGDLPRVARIVGEQQALKQSLPGRFQDAYVQDVVRRVREAGAYAQLPGGKISAFVLVCCPDGDPAPVRAALADLREVPFRLETDGARVLEV